MHKLEAPPAEPSERDRRPTFEREVPVNPFPSHAPVQGADVCDREDVLEAVAAAARGRWPLAICGRTGSGVTSVLLEGAARLRRHGIIPIVVRLDRAADPADLAPRVSAALEAARGSGESDRRLLIDDAERLAGAKGAVRDLLSETGVGGGAPILFGHEAEALAGLLGPEGEGRLREVGPIPLAAWLPYALERFLETNVWVSNDQVEAAHRLAGGHARHLQDLFHEIWDLAGGRGGRVEDSLVTEALERVLSRSARRWRLLWEALTPNQRRFLRGVAARGSESHPFSASFLERSGLGTASSAQRAASALVGRGLLEETVSGALRVTDTLLGRWLAEGWAGSGTAGQA